MNQEVKSFVSEDANTSRSPHGWQLNTLIFIALTWSIMQLWIASPFQDWSFIPHVLKIRLEETRIKMHLIFAFLVGFLSFAAFKTSDKSKIPWYDWLLFVLSASAVLYTIIFSENLLLRKINPTFFDIVFSSIGIIAVLEVTRRSIGSPIVVIAGVFIIYSLIGNRGFVPDFISHPGFNWDDIMSHQWFTKEGVFGIPLKVSMDFIFLFVLFGTLLDKSGGGNFLMNLSFATLGRFRGGPAKASIIASCTTGSITGSSIANVITTGTFTIPLMIKDGFSKYKSAAIEITASINSQIMPPVMGAAAFLIAEYVGIPYTQVLKHALIPAAVSYVTLLYIVHIEAVKNNIKPRLQKDKIHTMRYKIMITLASFAVFFGFLGGFYYLVKFLMVVFGKNASFVFFGLIFTLFVLGVKFKTQKEIDTNDIINHNISFLGVLRNGLEYILPIFLLIWCLIAEHMTPSRSVFYSTVFLLFTIFTRDILYDFFHGHKMTKQEKKKTIRFSMLTCLEGLTLGARNMVPIAVASACAGVITGSVNLTNLGISISDIIMIASRDSTLLALMLVALLSIVFGLGLPTTSNYIIVSSMMIPILKDISLYEGLAVPLIAMHLFVFYFGIMADVTPPVGLASFAGAAIAHTDPLKTGVQAFKYALRLFILPFIFIYNTDAILYGIDSIPKAIEIFFVILFGMLMFSSSMQKFLFCRLRKYETFALFLASMMVFFPSMFINVFFQEKKAVSIEEFVNTHKIIEVGERYIVTFAGYNILNQEVQINSSVAKNTSSFVQDVRRNGIIMTNYGSGYIIDDVMFGSPAFDDGIMPDFELKQFYIINKQPSDYYIISIALMLAAFVGINNIYRIRNGTNFKCHKKTDIATYYYI